MQCTITIGKAYFYPEDFQLAPTQKHTRNFIQHVALNSQSRSAFVLDSSHWLQFQISKVRCSSKRFSFVDDSRTQLRPVELSLCSPIGWYDREKARLHSVLKMGYPISNTPHIFIIFVIVTPTFFIFNITLKFILYIYIYIYIYRIKTPNMRYLF